MFTKGFTKVAGLGDAVAKLFKGPGSYFGKTVATAGRAGGSTIAEMRAANQALKPAKTMSQVAQQTRATTKVPDLGNLGSISQMRLANNPMK